ncbi:MAG: exopolysaccharide biosynthesis protein [Alphaproteobacteria bacterium]
MGAEAALAPAPPAKRTSQLLEEFAQAQGSSHVTVGEIVGAFGDRGLGFLLALFSLPNVIPNAIPGATIIFGIPSFIFALELALARKRIVLPGTLLRRRVDAASFRRTSARMAAVLRWFERLLKPRLMALTTSYAERFIGGFCIVLAIAAAAPIPFGHSLPALSLVVIGLGLIEADGLAILFGLALGLTGFVVAGLVISGLAYGVSFFSQAAATGSLLFG